MKPLALSFALACALVAGTAVAEPTVYSFGGIRFRQENTPVAATLVGDSANLGGIAFTGGLPDTTTQAVGFPSNRSAGFNDSLTLGRQTVATSGAGPRAVNLPKGNDGASARHGVSVTWGMGKGMPNVTGGDIVIFESGEDAGGPDGFIVRVKSASTGQYTRWYYQAAEKFVSFGSSTQGAFITTIDFSFLGIQAYDTVAEVQIANLVPTDRIDAQGLYAQGFIVPEGGAGYAKPEVKQGSDKTFEKKNGYDPDLLYVAGLHDVLTLP